MAVIDLSQLPAPDVVETLDFEAILAERKATLISLYPEDEQEAIARTLTLESEPLVKYLEENAYREVILRQRINDAAKAVMLARMSCSVNSFEPAVNRAPASGPSDPPPPPDPPQAATASSTARPPATHALRLFILPPPSHRCVFCPADRRVGRPRDDDVDGRPHGAPALVQEGRRARVVAHHELQQVDPPQRTG